MPSENNRKNLLRHLPKVDRVLARAALSFSSPAIAPRIVKDAVREEICFLREKVLSGEITEPGLLSIDVVADGAKRRATVKNIPRLRRVINATGVVIHTNLGRSPLPDKVVRQMQLVASGYSNLEYSLKEGKRGSRDDLIEGLLSEITGAEAATVVNNNAAAVMLVLNTLAAGCGVVVSRGELVEIGGSFRIPDVMSAGGARLLEVGTTNRTRIGDYRQAVDENTALLLKVHTSNYSIVGFSEEASVEDLVVLGREKGIPVMVDLGSGCLLDVRTLGLSHYEPTVMDVLKAGADVVTFSGDKLLGGPQAGVILGKASTIQRIRKNPMKRALRCGKITLAALEAVLKIYLNPETAVGGLPVLRMITASRNSVSRRAHRFADRLKELPVQVSFLPSLSKVGGGSLPLEEMPTVLLALETEALSAQDFEARLREQDPPVIGRIVEDRVCLDFRTVLPRELGELERAIRGAIGFRENT